MKIKKLHTAPQSIFLHYVYQNYFIEEEETEIERLTEPYHYS